MLKVSLVNLILIIITVVIHYECLRLMSDRLFKLSAHRRMHLLMAVFGSLIAHVIEIWLFALAFYALLQAGGWGALAGSAESSLADCFYFSISNYTSLGMGDIRPLGLLRYVSGFEALLGLVLITWTASFLFLEMQKIWGRNVLIEPLDD
jgi:hypothetical protein